MRSRLRNIRGNLLLVLAVLLTSVFAVGGFALEATLYLLKRTEIQQLAESVALGAALSLPIKEGVYESAQGWYDTLRIRDGVEVAPAAALSAGTVLTVTFDDNQDTASAKVPYKASSVTVSIKISYNPRILPIGGGVGGYTVVGEATAQLTPTDVVLVIDNSASLVDLQAMKEEFDTRGLNVSAGQLATVAQCLTPEWLNFKRGVVQLYDQLSQTGTFRVGVINTTSRSGQPFVLGELGKTTLTKAELEYDKDQPLHHSTMCGGLIEWDPDFEIPLNPNEKGDRWKPRRDLSSMMIDSEDPNWSIPEVKINIADDSTLLLREALWIQKAGYTDASGAIIPSSILASPTAALDMASSILKDSRRDDQLPVNQRLVILLTDDAGVSTENLGWSSSTPTPALPFCSIWKTNVGDSQLKLGVILFNHTGPFRSLTSSADLEAARKACLEPGSSQSGIFFAETGSETFTSETFQTKLIPLLAHAMKQSELLK